MQTMSTWRVINLTRIGRGRYARAWTVECMGGSSIVFVRRGVWPTMREHVASYRVVVVLKNHKIRERLKFELRACQFL